MEKLKKNFVASGFSVESMACTANCGCSTCNNCNCYTTSDYAGYQYVAKSTHYSSVYSSTSTSLKNEAYEMHYLG